MIVTRSQSFRNNSLELERMSDSKSDHTVLEVLSRTRMIEFDDGELMNGTSESVNNDIKKKIFRHESTN